VLAGGAIDLDEIASPKILDPWLHSDLCSWNVLTAAGFVNANHTRTRTPAQFALQMAVVWTGFVKFA
jgi:hypothetical protein